VEGKEDTKPLTLRVQTAYIASSQKKNEGGSARVTRVEGGPRPDQCNEMRIYRTGGGGEESGSRAEKNTTSNILMGKEKVLFPYRGEGEEKERAEAEGRGRSGREEEEDQFWFHRRHTYLDRKAPSARTGRRKLGSRKPQIHRRFRKGRKKKKKKSKKNHILPKKRRGEVPGGGGTRPP